MVINTGDINIGNNINVGNRNEIGNRVRNNDLNVNRDSLRRDNLYHRPENRDRKADTASVQKDFKRAMSKSDLKNNVYADRGGRISRNVDNTWEIRDKGNWKQDEALNKPITRDPLVKSPPLFVAGRGAGRPGSPPFSTHRAQFARQCTTVHDCCRKRVGIKFALRNQLVFFRHLPAIRFTLRIALRASLLY